jgi:hypothetical protein
MAMQKAKVEEFSSPLDRMYYATLLYAEDCGHQPSSEDTLDVLSGDICREFRRVSRECQGRTRQVIRNHIKWLTHWALVKHPHRDSYKRTLNVWLDIKHDLDLIDASNEVHYSDDNYEADVTPF